MWRQPPFDFTQGRLSAVPAQAKAAGACNKPAGEFPS
jgi:hypothetical protein